MNKKMVIGLIIAFIMISSIFGFVVDFAISPGAQKLKYNDFKFRVVNQQYFTKINGQEHAFIFFPGDLEYLQISPEVKTLLDKPVLTITYDPNSKIADNLGEAQYYFEAQLSDAKAIERAVTNNEGIDLPQKSCADATDIGPVIELAQSNQSGIFAENNCIKILALDPFDLYQQTERVIYSILGVMP